MKKTDLTIANTILSQIRAGTDTKGLNGGALCMICWAAETFVGLHNGLRFKVSGHKHKGWVQVILDPSDTYTVTLRGLDDREVASFSDVYCDMLTGIIDSAVETGE